MEIINFNEGWVCGVLGTNNQKPISIPHDAMREEPRSESSLGAANIGWYEGLDYLYKKTFFVPEDYQEKKVVFEFEGVYRNAEVIINGKKAGFRPYGYTNFYVEADAFLHFGSENTIEVIARNSDQPNSRWYTGTGIYRPVNLLVLPKKHLLLNGIKITTVSTKPPVISLALKSNSKGEALVSIIDGEEVIARSNVSIDGSAQINLPLPNAKAWSPEEPNLYQCQIEYEGSQYQTRFGLRTLTWDSEAGLLINGVRRILKGACIHHDNGLLGAAAFPDAERRKVKLLQEAGYNAIRSAHNPCSKALLDACDELGMLVMDEYVDMWYTHKTRYDYANDFSDWWRQDLADMVDKDFNHPSVILYSTGNEVSETAEPRGIELTKELTEHLHGLDPTRPVTCGVNIFFNYLSSLGFGVYTDEKAQKEKKKAVGSEFYNKLAGLLGDKTMKLGATLRGSDRTTYESFSNMDIAGYNYGILRYKKDLKKYPKRLILGTETFCKDAFYFLELAKKHPRIIGDFVWAGMDYIGEAGIGSWVYEDAYPKNASPAGWLTAGSGRLDITGAAGGETLYTKVAFEKTTTPLLAVKPVYQKGKHSPSAWKLTDAMPAWTWPGCEGQKAEVEVYARAAQIALYLNDQLVVKKKMKNDCRSVVKTTYQSGTLTVVAYDENEQEIGRSSLVTAQKETQLTLEPESRTVSPRGLAFIRLRYTDRNGILKPMENHEVAVSVKGGKLLGLGHACPYNPEGYTGSKTKTYYGEALAIVQADPEANEIELMADDGSRSERTAIQINEVVKKSNDTK